MFQSDQMVKSNKANYGSIKLDPRKNKRNAIGFYKCNELPLILRFPNCNLGFEEAKIERVITKGNI